MDIVTELRRAVAASSKSDAALKKDLRWRAAQEIETLRKKLEQANEAVTDTRRQLEVSNERAQQAKSRLANSYRGK